MTTRRYCVACGGPLSPGEMDDRRRMICSACGRIDYENPVPATAAVVLDEEGAVLLVKRGAEPKIGEWCLPGGFVEVDETPETGCLRELREETGLNGEIASLLGIEMGNSHLYRAVMVVGYRIAGVRGVPRPGDDSVAVRYFKPHERPRLAFRSHQRILEKALGLGSSLRPRLPRGAYVISSEDHIQVVRDACRAGARVVQFREKRLLPGRMLETARELRRITREAGALLVVNDHIDLAMLCHADGVHMGQDDFPPADARRILPAAMLLGVSTHSEVQALEAEAAGADYIGIGPVYGTPTKADYPPIGMEIVRRVAAAASIPTVGIGGINAGNLEQVVSTGVTNVAMVRAFQEDAAGMVKRVNDLLFTAAR